MDFHVSAVSPALKLILLKWKRPQGIFRSYIMDIQIETNTSKSLKQFFSAEQNMAAIGYEQNDRIHFNFTSSLEKLPGSSASSPSMDPRSLSYAVSTSFSSDSDIPDAGRIVDGSSFIADMTYEEDLQPMLNWRLKLPDDNETSFARAFRPVGFVVYQKPAFGTPRVVDVIQGVFDYSASVRKPATECKMILLVAPLVQALKNPLETLFHEPSTLTVDQCPSTTVNATVAPTTAPTTTTPTIHRVFSYPFYGYNVSLPLFSALPHGFISERGVMNILNPWFADLTVQLKETFNFTEVGFPNDVVDVFVRLPFSQIQRHRRSSESTRSPTAIVDAAIVFTDRPPPGVFLRQLQQIAALLESNSTVQFSNYLAIDLGSISLTAGSKSKRVPPVGDPEPILDAFCFLSRFYYAACISKQKCGGQKSRIVLPGERGFRGDDQFLNRPDAVCLCPEAELPICVATTPFSSIEPTLFDVVKWERQVFHLALFVPLGISGTCILVLVIMAYFVGRHKRRSHRKFLELARRRHRFMAMNHPEEIYSPDTSDVAVLTENDATTPMSEPTPILLSHPSDVYINRAFAPSPEMGRSKSLAKKIGNVGNRTSAFFPVLSRHHPISLPSVMGEEDANVSLTVTSPAPPVTPPPLPENQLSFPEGISSVQNKGFYVIQNESSMGSRGSHGVGMLGLSVEKEVEERSLNSWRTTWDTLDTPVQESMVTEDKSILGGVAFPSAISAMNGIAPRTPGDVNIVAENLASSRSRLDLPQTASRSQQDLNQSGISALNGDRTEIVNGVNSSRLPESWRDVLPPIPSNLPESWRDVLRKTL